MSNDLIAEDLDTDPGLVGRWRRRFAARNVEYPLTHDIPRLLTLLKDQSIDFPPVLMGAAALTTFAVRFRYDELPVVDADEPPFDRGAAISLAAPAIEWAEHFAG
jgi:HEPN domain-containing protein